MGPVSQLLVESRSSDVSLCAPGWFSIPVIVRPRNVGFASTLHPSPPLILDRIGILGCSRDHLRGNVSDHPFSKECPGSTPIIIFPFGKNAFSADERNVLATIAGSPAVIGWLGVFPGSSV